MKNLGLKQHNRTWNKTITEDSELKSNSLIFLHILFVYLREREWTHRREKERGRSRLPTEQGPPHTPRSWSELKADVYSTEPLSALSPFHGPWLRISRMWHPELAVWKRFAVVTKTCLCTKNGEWIRWEVSQHKPIGKMSITVSENFQLFQTWWYFWYIKEKCPWEDTRLRKNPTFLILIWLNLYELTKNDYIFSH